MQFDWLAIFMCCSIVQGIKIIDATPFAEGERADQTKNDSPIIGVLAQEIAYQLNNRWPGVYSSYIAASYIKFVEGGGARAVPIW